jgi:hypothetical protein
LRERVDLLLCGEHLLAKDADMLIRAMANLLEPRDLGDYLTRYKKSSAHAMAAIEALRRDPELCASLLSDPRDFRGAAVERDVALSLLRDSNPTMVAIGRAIASGLDPLPSEFLKLLIADLKSSDSEDVERAFSEFYDLPASLSNDAIPPELLQAVEDLLEQKEFEEQAWTWLFSWSR